MACDSRSTLESRNHITRNSTPAATSQSTHAAPASASDLPRERVLRCGPEVLGDAELVALLLRTGHGGQDAVDLAGSLLARFGGIRGLLCQGAGTLAAVAGLGPAKVAGLVAVRELARRFEFANACNKRLIAGAAEARRYLYLHAAGFEREVFGLLLLDARNRLLAAEDLFLGSVDRSAVYPREVLKACVRRNAAAVVLYHNHPSGTAEPSPADEHITARLKAVLDEIDVTLVDHLIIGSEGIVSMAERGMV